MLTQVLLLVAAFQTQPAIPPRDGASERPGSASVSGLISEQHSNRPLHRAIVTLVPAAGTPPLEALTDADGRYEFVGLEAGAYGVVATAGDLRATHLRQAFGRPEPLDPFSNPPRSTINLKPGERRTGVDIALVRALAIEGRVLDPWDMPMAEVEVSLSRADGTRFSSRGFRSDDRGEFRAFGLAPGRYRACAAPQGSDVSSDGSRFVRTCYSSAVVEGDATDIILTTSDAGGIEIRVQRSGTFSVSGYVTDAAGSTVDTPHVMAVPFDRLGDSAYARGSEGRFVLRGLTPGRYLLKASVGGPENRDDTRPPAREEEVGYTSVDVVTTEVAGTVVQLSKGRTVSGRVAFEGGLPMPVSQLRMAVQAAPTGLSWSRTIRDRLPIAAVSDKLTFELKGIYQLPQTIAVTGLPDGWIVKSVRLDDRDITGVPTNLVDSTTPGFLDVIATSRVARPAVRVTDERGDLVSLYHAVIYPTNQSRWQMPPPHIQGQPSADGVVKLGPILPGDYLVAALVPADFLALVNDVARVRELAAVAARVTFSEGDDRTLEMKVIPLPGASRR